MHLLATVLRVAFAAAVIGSAARTAWVVHREGFASERTTSWLLYLLGQRWPWVIVSVSILAGFAYADSLDALAVGVFLGHVFSPMVASPMPKPEPDTGAAQP